MAVPTLGARRRRRPRPANAIENKVNNFKTATMVDDDTSLAKVNRYVDGSPWKVEYYNQITGANDLVTLLDTSVSGDLQQYSRVKNLELRVSSPLDTSVAADATGEATIVNSITPQEGDIFKATVAGNREALLLIVTVTQEHYNNNPLFKIEYKIDSFLDQNSSRYVNLVSKVAKEYVYDDDYTMTESAPILTTGTYAFKKRIEKDLVNLTNTFVRKCISNKLRLIAIPGQMVEICDPYLEDYIFKILNYTGDNELNRVNRISAGVELMSTDNIWMTLLNKDINALPDVKKNFAMTDTKGLVIGSVLANGLVNKERSVLRIANVPSNTMPEFGTGDYTYLFTGRFYDDPTDTTLSILEKLVYQYLNEDSLDKDMMVKVLDSVRYWTDVETFYYIPVLIILIKDTIRKTRDEI